jgi:hypothetical protein
MAKTEFKVVLRSGSLTICKGMNNAAKITDETFCFTITAKDLWLNESLCSALNLLRISTRYCSEKEAIAAFSGYLSAFTDSGVNPDTLLWIHGATKGFNAEKMAVIKKHIYNGKFYHNIGILDNSIEASFQIIEATNTIKHFGICHEDSSIIVRYFNELIEDDSINSELCDYIDNAFMIDYKKKIDCDIVSKSFIETKQLPKAIIEKYGEKILSCGTAIEMVFSYRDCD